MTQLEQRMYNAIASACAKYIASESIDWEQRKYECAKNYAIGLMTSKWYEGTEQQAIERGMEFAESFIEKLKND